MKLMIIALSNMRKHRSSIVVTGILVACAVVLLYSSINAISSVSGYAREMNEKQNAADIIMYTSYEDEERINAFFSSSKEITEYESRQLFGSGIKYKNITKDSKTEQLEFRFLNYDEKGKLSDFIIYDQQEELKENSIILPMYMKSSLGYQAGDQIQLEFPSGTGQYEIYGFMVDVMFPNPNIVTMYECMLPGKEFSKLEKYGCLEGIGYFMKISKELYPSRYVTDFKNNISTQIPDLVSSNIFYVNDSQSMCYAASTWAYMIMALFAVFAIFAITIAIIVMRFSIITTIEDNLPNIGILEAAGFTSRQMMGANIVEYLFGTVMGISFGFLGAWAVKSSLENIINSVTGLQWRGKLSLPIAGICILVMVLIVVSTTYMASRRIRRITPLQALRGGINDHNFKRNHVALETSRLHVNVAIGLKNIMNNVKQNTSIFLIVGALTFICATFFNVYYNIVVDPEGIIKLVGLEKPDISYEIHYKEGSNIILQSNDGTGIQKVDYMQMSNEISSMEGIEAVVPYTKGSLNLVNGDLNAQADINAYLNCDELRINTLVKGRYPEAKNEIVLATQTAAELHVEIGDVIYVESAEELLNYVVVGIEQHVYNLGKGALLNIEGLERVNPGVEVGALYIYTEEGMDNEEMIHTLQSKFNDRQSNIVDVAEYFNTILFTFSSATAAMCLFSLIATLVIVCLIIYLLIKMKLLRDRKLLGIYKALGFTTPQLVAQIILSYVPVIAGGAILGGVAAGVFGNSLVAVIFRVISGTQKCDFTTMYGYILLSVLLVIFVSILIAIACSVKIRKIEPCKMIQEQ